MDFVWTIENSVTVRDSHPLPRIARSVLFSSIDLSSGYWQIELEEADKEKAACTTGKSLYQFKVMPMGLTNITTAFQRLMVLVLKGLLCTTCVIYLDIIVFDRLRTSQLKLRPDKWQLFQPSVTFLGHVVSAQGSD